MTTVSELIPGDKIQIMDKLSAVFISQTTHPIWPHLQLVIWRLSDWSWAHDALDSRQYIGEVDRLDPVQTTERLKEWLLGGPK